MATNYLSSQRQQPRSRDDCPAASGHETNNASHQEGFVGPTTWDPLIAEVAKATPVLPARTLDAGATAGEYRIVSVLGQGGFGTVYRAVHSVIGKAVAVKVLREQFCTNPNIVARFVEEGCAVNRIMHPNIVDIFGFGTLDTGQQFLVMELLEGESLGQRLRREGPIDPSEALELLGGIASALDATHAQRILHRDLKPENVFLVRRGKHAGQPKLLDFGISKILHDPQSGVRDITQGGILGTRAYMAPEQCVGTAIDARVDIYALGIIAYEMLTGAHPFETENVTSSDVRSRSRGIPASERNAALQKAVDAPLARMFALDPDLRPTRASEAVEAMAAALGAAGQGNVRRHSLPRRRLLLLAVLLLVIGALIGYGWIARTFASRPAEPAKIAGSALDTTRLTRQAPIAAQTPSPPPTATTVSVSLDVTPAQVEVYVDGRLAPTQRGVLTLDRGDRPAKFVLRAPGYQEETFELTPDRDQRLHVRLTRLATPKRRAGEVRVLSPKTGELEF